MTTREGRSATEERLLDAALEQVFAGEGAAARPIARAPARVRRQWVAAAVVLFALAITAGLMWHAHGTEAGATPAQEPAEPTQLPPQVRASGKDEIEALPADTVNLCAFLDLPQQIDCVTHLRALRRLQIAPSERVSAVLRHARPEAQEQARKAVGWDRAAAGFLAPLATLSELEELELTFALQLRPEHCAALKSAPKLRSLKFAQGTVVDDALVTALAELPHLRELHFDIVQLDAAAVARLRRLPLEGIEVSRCPGFDAPAFAELCAMETLRDARFSWFGNQDLFTGNRDTRLWGPDGGDLEKLDALPALRQLCFVICELPNDALTALPTNLTSLELAGVRFTPDELGQLRRFPRLRHLRLDTTNPDLGPFALEAAQPLAAKADAFAAALGSLRLTSLDYTGALTDALLEQIAHQPDLATARLRTDRIPPLGAIAAAPTLRDLELIESLGPSHLTVEDLAPLARCRSLRRFDLRTYDSAITREELMTQLGPSVAVTVTKSELPVKK